MDNFEINFALPEDLPQILSLLRDFAEFEELLDEFLLTEDRLFQGLFAETKSADCLVAKNEGKIVALAIFYYVFRTFRGEKSLYLEDLYVLPNFRGKGLGKLMLKTVAQTARRNNCQRMDWQTAKWNASAIDFYKNLGAENNDGLLDFRLIDENFTELSR